MSGQGLMSPRVALVCFAFGVAQVPRPGPLPSRALPGPVLLRLLADLGLSEPAARSVLLRMRREGWLESRRSGRAAEYRLASAIDAAQARIGAQLQGQRPDWDGSFRGVIYEVPEAARSYRDRLRRTAHLLGYATLHPGLLIAATDRWDELARLLPAAPDGASVLRTRLTLSAADSRAVAARLWRMAELAERYRAVEARARQQIARAGQHQAGPAGLRAFAAATLPVFNVTAEDPDLPAALLPPGWPGPGMGQILDQAYRAFAPLITGYLAEVAAVTG